MAERPDIMGEIEVNMANFMPPPTEKAKSNSTLVNVKKKIALVAVLAYLVLLATGSVLVICSAIRGLPL